ncbi:amino acid ABC transporter permease [Mesorhizobium sp. YM1C-6-2]|jgi:polar amino acid transport system permease protein|uniref:amino acid ABC transporter permease n=1 Tax=Mesorhizobium sp. YM1C-6-2 TaxID=1827501 RepID=UPI000EF235B7|nr:amino acid ABC transporter permease [Mesorhizobium sp. YM1C-6-2]RLP26792.1 amino acid ABC transporter permease [Mesorhizobium sp. YM1C-6-2]
MDFTPVWNARWLLLDSFLTTLLLSTIAVVVGTLVGAIVAVLRTLNVGILNVVLRAYVELFRGTPLLMQLFFVYFGLPMLGVNVDKFWAAFSAISLYTGAYVAEVFRAGVEAVPRGQVEASTALGLTFVQRLTYVIAPQALRVALPPLVGVYVSVIKDTSLATVIGYNELMRRAMELVLQYGRPLEIFLVVGILYFIICFPISKFSEWLERRLARNGA